MKPCPCVWAGGTRRRSLQGPSFCCMKHLANDWVPHLLGKVPHLLGKVPLATGKVPHLLGKVPLATGTVPHLLGTVPLATGLRLLAHGIGDLANRMQHLANRIGHPAHAAPGVHRDGRHGESATHDDGQGVGTPPAWFWRKKGALGGTKTRYDGPDVSFSAHRGLLWVWKAFVRSVLVWLGLWGGLGTASLAHASFFDSTPGKLARGHADIDGPTNCTKCHPANKREIDEKKCLDCHKPVADRMAQKSGLHGSQKALGRPCVLCHKEHRGLDADLFGWAALGGQQKFAHDTLSRFPLKGRHAVVECKDCHKQKTQTGRPSFLLAPTDCAPCHTKHPHGDMHGQVAACERCHDEKNWRRVEPMKFDHATDTRFPLEGKHVGTPCNSCHPRTLFRLTNWAASIQRRRRCRLCGGGGHDRVGRW